MLTCLVGEPLFVAEDGWFSTKTSGLDFERAAEAAAHASRLMFVR